MKTFLTDTNSKTENVLINFIGQKSIPERFAQTESLTSLGFSFQKGQSPE